MAQLLDRTTDQHIVYHGRTWDQFKLILRADAYERIEHSEFPEFAELDLPC
ncbi:hypothetical protein HJG54_17105 [Leptolyngbya sp. NK1-12]|uniref:Uncharacterized protein n=1 Tax=Leptolyngbya sp. NK1-12 TaxID=2547451 RepID=A0AA97AHD4_9CYAN|nr:hypothetical protein [Leptolyngbya sp. NK1-12]WNZ24404.1 hypothetical protein HJG54_17105 [Leptolyngbya sp. NK1-12]